MVRALAVFDVAILWRTSVLHHCHLDNIERRQTVGSSWKVLRKGSRAPSPTRLLNVGLPSRDSHSETAPCSDLETGLVSRWTQIQYQTFSEVEMTAVAFPQ